jgi:peroxiredoxin
MLTRIKPAVVILLTTVCGSATADEPAKTSPLGRQVAEFQLKDYRGKEHQLADFQEQKLLVVAFLGTECPLVKVYGPRLEALANEYAPQGVAFLGVNSNVQDSNTEIAAYARIHNLSFPIVKDLGNRVADQMGAVRTPEVFVLDAERKIRYRGRIDDQYGVGVVRDDVSESYLSDAIDALLAGKPVARPETESVGCYIGRAVEPDETSPVTYANQIARILRQRCVECHRPGEIAPFALTNYDEVVGWAETINEVVRDRRMPPWHADPAHGDFANDRRLSDEEVKLIHQWVRAGAPEGDRSQLPAPNKYVAGWRLPRRPDVVIAMRDEPYQVPAEGAVRYQYFSADAGFEEDKWVSGAEVIPGNRAVVHHVLVFVKPPGGGPLRDRGLLGDFLTAYVPGARGRTLPEGMAKFVPAGSKLIFQVHYTPIGSEQQDLSKVGLIFADPDAVTHQVMTTKAAQRRLDIPPHADNHRVEATSKAAQVDVQLLAMMPHMHLRGKAFRYEAVLPDGRREVLLDVPRYDFNWQTGYVLAKPRTLPAGAQIHCVAHFDNSKDNLANPDPTATVHWGDQTWDEMMIGYFDIALPVEVLRKSVDAKRDPVQEILDRYDTDKDGEVARSEVPLRVLPIFNRMDKNDDDIVTREEIAVGLGG